MNKTQDTYVLEYTPFQGKMLIVSQFITSLATLSICAVIVLGFLKADYISEQLQLPMMQQMVLMSEDLEAKSVLVAELKPLAAEAKELRNKLVAMRSLNKVLSNSLAVERNKHTDVERYAKTLETQVKTLTVANSTMYERLLVKETSPATAKVVDNVLSVYSNVKESFADAYFN